MRAVSYRRTELGIAERRKRAELLRIEQLKEQLKEQQVMAPPAAPVAKNNVIQLKIKPGPYPSFHSVAARICRATGYSLAEIRSTSRVNKLVLARQAICYWVRRLTGYSLQQIGRLLGDLDHTTVMHAIAVYPKKRAASGRHLAALSLSVAR